MTAFADLVADPYARRRYLAILEPYDPDLTSPDTVTLYYSDDGFTSRPGDSPANRHFEARIVEALNLSRNLVARDGRLGGRSDGDNGVLVLANGDGGLDFMAGLAWDGRRVRIYLGGDGFAFADFGLIFDGTAEGAEFSDEAVTIRLRSLAARADRPVQANLYAGSGGGEGGDDLKGKPKPLAYGMCRNVPAVLVSYAVLLWQVHDGPTESIAVFSAGAAITFGTDHASLALLLAATVTAATYDTCLATGHFRLGSAPGASVITADVEGDDTGGTYAASVARIVERIAETRAGFSGAEIDGDAFDDLHAANGAVAGVWTGTDAATAADLFDRLCDSIGAWWGFLRDGRLTVGRLEAPADPAAASYDTLSIVDLERRPQAIPPHRHVLTWRRNWRPFLPGEVAGGASAARREFLLAETRQETAEDAAVLTRHPLSEELRLETLLDAQAAGAAEAARLQALYGDDPCIYEARLKTPPFALRLGDVVEVTWPRWGMQAGKLLRVIGFAEVAAENEVTLTLWG